MNEFNALQEVWKKGQIKNYLNYTILTEEQKGNLDFKLNKDIDKMNDDGKNIQADIKSVSQISKSFDEIIKLFYEIQKHKREKKQASSSQFGSSKRFDASSAVSSIQKDFFVSKVDLSAIEFNRQLSGVIDAFFGEYLKMSIGIIPLIDAFIEFNKHRGTDIVSSKEFKEACSLLSSNSSRLIIIFFLILRSVALHKTKDGVLALRLKSFNGNDFFSNSLQPILYQAQGGCIFFYFL